MKTQTFIDDGYLQVSTELNSYSLFFYNKYCYV